MRWVIVSAIAAACGGGHATSPPPSPTAADVVAEPPEPMARPDAPAPSFAPPLYDERKYRKEQLEQRIYSGRGSYRDIQALIALCKEDGDAKCMAWARQIAAEQFGTSP